MLAGLASNSLDASAGFLDETDSMQQIRDQGVAPDALAPQLGRRHSLREAPRAHDLDAIGVDLDEDIGPFQEPISMHDGIGDGLAQSVGRVLRDIRALEPLYAVGRAGIALDEAHRVLDIGQDPVAEILAVQNVNLFGALGQQAGDVSVREEAANVLREKEGACVEENQFAAEPLSRADVDEHVLDVRSAGDAGTAQPSVEFLGVEVVRIPETGAGREIEPDRAFVPEEIAKFNAAEFLGHRALAPEEPVAALHWFRFALADMHDGHAGELFDPDPDGRVAVASDVLDAGAESVRVLDAGDRAVIAHAEQDLAAESVGQGHHLAGERGRKGFLEFEGRALAFLDEPLEIGGRHGGTMQPYLPTARRG